MRGRFRGGTLEEVLEHCRADALVLRQHRHDHDADLIEELVFAVEQVAEDYLLWISEDDAQLRSGHGAEWLRGRFDAWEREGHARRNGKCREYRQLVIPKRLHIELVRAGLRAGKEAA